LPSLLKDSKRTVIGIGSPVRIKLGTGPMKSHSDKQTHVGGCLYLAGGRAPKLDIITGKDMPTHRDFNGLSSPQITAKIPPRPTKRTEMRK
jgi:hypothetical protein